MSTQILKAVIHLPRRVNAETSKHLGIAQEQQSLDAAEAYLKQHFTGERSWFVYRTPTEVSLHRHTASGSIMGPRVAVIFIKSMIDKMDGPTRRLASQ